MKKLIAFRSRKVIACHSRLSVHKNAGVGIGGRRVWFGLKNEGKVRKQFRRTRLEWGATP